jgi:hypothetical protein
MPYATSRLLQPAVLSAVVYIGLILLLPPNKAALHTYGLSGSEYRALLFALSIPSVVTWVAAFIGYAKLRQYVDVIRKSPEGGSFAILTRGYAWLAWSLPITATAYLILNAVSDKWPSLLSTNVIFHNYIGLILPLVAFTLIGTASRSLVNRAKLDITSASVRGIMLVFLAAGVLYCFLTFQQFNLDSLGSTHNPYYLPVWLMVLTVIIPYLYAWFIGLLAAYEIMLFSKHTEGVLYRSALRLLVAGLVTIIVSSVALQFSSSVQPAAGHVVFGYHLVLNLIFRIIAGIGFILVAFGAGKLRKIEEI